jgi:hypothetical protein
MFKLISRHLSVAQLLAFFLSNLVGLYIVLMGIQVYYDIKPMFTQNDSFLKPEHLVVSKKVNTLTTVMDEKPVFTEEEINNIATQPFVKDVAIFVPSMFSVHASVGGKMMGGAFNTAMFFEAIPDKFIDVESEKWHYKEGSNFVPIIIPRNYLNLYNFGFASSQGLPVMSEKIISSVSIRFSLVGKKGRKNVEGKIVGFSDRFNTILVPMDFILSTNRMLTGNEVGPNSRAIVEVENLADERISTFIANNDYDVENDVTDASKTKNMLLLLMGGVVVVGLLICTLSIYILMLSIFLLIQKMTEHIDNLLLIGYTTHAVAKPYCLIGTILNGLSLVFAVLFLYLTRSFYLAKLEMLYAVEFPSMASAVMIGVALCLFIFMMNTLVIYKKVSSIWNIHKK